LGSIVYCSEQDLLFSIPFRTERVKAKRNIYLSMISSENPSPFFGIML